MLKRLISIGCYIVVVTGAALGQQWNYDLYLAHDYARTWCDDINPFYGDALPIGSDAPNFISQILTNAGMGNCELHNGSNLDPRGFEDSYCSDFYGDGGLSVYWGAISSSPDIDLKTFCGVNDIGVQNPRYQLIAHIPEGSQWPWPPEERDYIQDGDIMIVRWGNDEWPGHAAWFGSSEIQGLPYTCWVVQHDPMECGMGDGYALDDWLDDNPQDAEIWLFHCVVSGATATSLTDIATEQSCNAQGGN